MTRTSTTAQPSLQELWVAYERQKQEVDRLAARHEVLREQASEAFVALSASSTVARELFDVAYEAEFGSKPNVNPPA